ncbi:hypothetical protein BH20CHL4_BH20CHL4_09890 [soil metagenome]
MVVELNAGVNRVGYGLRAIRRHAGRWLRLEQWPRGWSMFGNKTDRASGTGAAAQDI